MKNGSSTEKSRPVVPGSPDAAGPVGGLLEDVGQALAAGALVQAAGFLDRERGLEVSAAAEHVVRDGDHAELPGHSPGSFEFGFQLGALVEHPAAVDLLERHAQGFQPARRAR